MVSRSERKYFEIKFSSERNVAEVTKIENHYLIIHKGVKPYVTQIPKIYHG